MNCKKCNAPISKMDKFCPDCGAKIEKEEISAVKNIPNKTNKKLSLGKKKILIAIAILVLVLIIVFACLFPKIKRMVLGEFNYYLIREKSQISEFVDSDQVGELSKLKGKQIDLVAKINSQDKDSFWDTFEDYTLSLASDNDGKIFAITAGVKFDGENYELLRLIYKDNRLIVDSKDVFDGTLVKKVEVSSNEENMSWLADAMKSILKRSDEYIDVEKNGKKVKFVIDRDGMVNFMNLAVEELEKHDEYTKFIGDVSDEMEEYIDDVDFLSYLTGEKKLAKNDLNEEAEICYTVTYGEHNYIEKRVLTIGNDYLDDYELASIETSDNKNEKSIEINLYPERDERFRIEFLKKDDSVLITFDNDYYEKVTLNIEGISLKKVSGIAVPTFDASFSYVCAMYEEMSGSLSGSVDGNEYVLSGKLVLDDEKYKFNASATISETDSIKKLKDYSGEKNQGDIEFVLVSIEDFLTELFDDYYYDDENTDNTYINDMYTESFIMAASTIKTSAMSVLYENYDETGEYAFYEYDFGENGTISDLVGATVVAGNDDIPSDGFRVNGHINDDGTISDFSVENNNGYAIYDDDTGWHYMPY